MSIRTALPTLGLALLFVAAACSPAERGLVARAGDHTLTVEETTGMLESQPRLGGGEAIVRAVADLWVDYTLLAETLQQDTSLASLNLQPMLQPQLEQQMVLEFRDSVVTPDTSFTEAELREAYQEEGSDVQIDARHILLSFPQSGETTDAQRDSIEALARELRERAVGGEGFADLAREYSDDPGSAAQGGDLGAFSRGQMVPAFEEAAFALDSGEISQPVETPYGIHLIKVEGRETPSFEENRAQFARQLRNRRVFQAESTYVAGVEDSAQVEVVQDAHEVVRQLAARPGRSLTSRARRRPLVRYQDGAVTAGDVQQFMQGRAPQQRAQLEQASDQQVEQILQNLARRELLVNAAREAGFEVSEQEKDSLRAQLVQRLRQAVSRIGLDTIAPREGESRTEAVDRAVRDLLTSTLAGQQQVLPLGNLAYTLRREHDAEVFEAGITRVTRELAPESQGGEQGGSGPAGAPDSAPARPGPASAPSPDPSGAS